MNHKTIVNDLYRASRSGALDGPVRRMDAAETRARAGLRFAIRETVLALPFREASIPDFAWDADDLSLSMMTGDGQFRFHLAAERRGARMLSIAVLSWEDDGGSATWEAPVPEELFAAVEG